MSEAETTQEVLRRLTYGLYVAATISADGPYAATVSWVTQVSFQPRLVAVAMRKGTAICGAVRESRRFALHLIGVGQVDFAKAFFKVTRAGPDEISGYRFTVSEQGLPIFDDALAWLECEVIEEAGATSDHQIYIAQIIGSGLRDPCLTSLALRDTPWHYGG